MKKLLLSLLLAGSLSAQTTVQKVGGGNNTLSNGSIVAGNNTSITTSGSGTIVATNLVNLASPAGQNGKAIGSDGTNYVWEVLSGSGTVTSVSLTMPNLFSVSGSPVTVSGTLAVTLANQAANLVFAGPTTGAAAAPTFRSLVAADIPSLSSLYAPATSGNSILYANGSGGFANVTIGSNLTFSAGTLSATGGGGGTPGGTSGQSQYNNAGSFGGYTVGGDGTLNTGTGALTITKSGGVAFGSAAFTASSAYEVPLTFGAGLTRSTNTVTGNVTSVAGRIGAVVLTPADVSLSSVTNDVQTKAALVPNTVPSAAQVLLGNAGGTAYAPVSLSGPVSVTSAGATSVATLNQNTTGTAADLSATLIVGHGGTGATTITGLVKGNGTSPMTAATAGTDYAGLASANSFTGVQSYTAAPIRTETAISSNVIDLTKNENTQSLSTNVTWTFSGGHAAGRWTGWRVSADLSARTITLPAGVPPLGSSVSAALASFVVPSTSTMVGAFYDDGSTYWIVNNPPVTTGTKDYVLSTSPTLITPLLGVVTSADFSSGTFTWPTFNQNTTGTAADLSATLIVGHGGTGATTLTAHGVVVGNGTSPANVTSAGTSGQILTSNGSGADPTFQNAAGGGTVSVVGAGSLTSTALVTGGGSTTLQTPSATSTLDSSGNLKLAGNLGIGNTPSTSTGLLMGATLTGGTQFGMNLAPQFDHTASTFARLLSIGGTLGSDSTATIVNAYDVNISQPSIANSSTVTNLYGIYINGISNGGTLNYAVYTNGGLVHFGDNLDVAGTIKAGSGPTTLTDSAGKILSAALNTVGVAQGGTGTTTRVLLDSSVVSSLDWSNRNLVDSTGGVSIGWDARALENSLGQTTLDWQGKALSVSWALNTPASGNLSNTSGLPIVAGTTGTLSVARGGTNLTSGTSGGILGYTASGTLASSAALTANTLVIGGGAGATPTTTTTGTGVLTAIGNAVDTSGGIITKAPHSLTFTIDGGGSVLTAGSSVPIKTPYGGTLVGYTMMVSPSGSLTFNILRAANTAGLPTASIINSVGGGGGTGTLPAISSGVEGSSTTFTSWGSTTITALDNLCLAITSPTTSTQCTFVLYYK